jgi:hypothetical protein
MSADKEIDYCTFCHREHEVVKGPCPPISELAPARGSVSPDPRCPHCRRKVRHVIIHQQQSYLCDVEQHCCLRFGPWRERVILNS